MAIPSQPQKYYNFANQSIIVGGYNLSGFDDDGTVAYEPQDDKYTHSVGADGQVTISVVNDPRLIATLTVKETGKAYQRLAQLAAQQEQSPTPQGAEVTYKHVDPHVGDRVNSGNAIFLNWPSVEKASEAGSREFEILLPNGAPKFKFANQNPTPDSV